MIVCTAACIPTNRTAVHSSSSSQSGISGIGGRAISLSVVTKRMPAIAAVSGVTLSALIDGAVLLSHTAYRGDLTASHCSTLRTRYGHLCRAAVGANHI